MPELILASTSKYRRELLERLRVPFRCVAPTVDEAAEAAKLSTSDPALLAGHLARLKAQDVATREPQAITIGSDQVCAYRGQILHKPGTAEKAREQLQQLQGKQYELLTAVSVFQGREVVTWVVKTHLFMRKLSKDEIARYIAADEPLDCAGSYKIESLGISLFESIQGSDHTAIIGLPLIQTAQVLRELGAAVP